MASQFHTVRTETPPAASTPAPRPRHQRSLAAPGRWNGPQDGIGRHGRRIGGHAHQPTPPPRRRAQEQASSCQPPTGCARHNPRAMTADSSSCVSSDPWIYRKRPKSVIPRPQPTCCHPTHSQSGGRRRDHLQAAGADLAGGASVSTRSARTRGLPTGRLLAVSARRQRRRYRLHRREARQWAAFRQPAPGAKKHTPRRQTRGSRLLRPSGRIGRASRSWSR